MTTEALQFTKNELIDKTATKTKRYPNLSTVIMVEDFLKSKQDAPLKIAQIKKQLPKQVMHQTLQVILEYL